MTGRPGGATPAVDVVIVNWNTGDCLRACVESLAASTGEFRFGRVVVVDNASSDGSAELPPSWLPVTVVRNEANRGFAAACNQGARLGSAPYLLLLNPDTTVAPDAVAAVVAFLESEVAASVGICGGSVSGPDGVPGISASRFPTLGNVAAGVVGLDRLLPRLFPPRHLAPAELAASRPVDQVIGAFFLVRRRLWNELGGLDERYFLYYEEVDFCLRARRLGWGAYLLADARLVHVANVSARRSGGLALSHSLRSRGRYAARHWTRPRAAALVALTVAVELPLRLVRAALRGGAELRDVAGAAAAYLRFVGSPAGRGPGAPPTGPPAPAELSTQDSRSAR